MLGSWSAEKERLGKKKAKIGVVQFFLRLYMEGTKGGWGGVVFDAIYSLNRGLDGEAI